MKKIKSALLLILNFAKCYFQDLMLIAGYSSLVYGVHMLNKPAAYIVGGLLLLWAFMPKSVKKTGGN